MRFILSVSLVMAALFVGGKVQAQEKDKDKKSEATPGIKEVTEIGGKSFEEWLKEMRNSDRSRAEAAIQTIVHFPHAKAPAAVKEIIEELSSTKPLDANTRLALISALGAILGQAADKVGPFQTNKGIELLNRSLKDPQIMVRIRAMTALATIGPAARGALKELMDELTYPIDLDLRVHAISSIGSILGQTLMRAQKRDEQLQALTNRAVLLLSKATDHPQLTVRISALSALSAIGPDANQAIPQIILQLKDFKGTWEVRQTAALALGRVGFDASFQNANALSGQKALIDALSPVKEPCSQVRLAAINSIVLHGFPRNFKDPKAKPKGFDKEAPVILALDRVAENDPEPPLQITANLAVMRLTLSVPSKNLDNLKTLMKHKEPAIRGQAIQAVGTIGDKAKDAIPYLMDSLYDKEPAVTMLCIWSLSRMGTKAVDAVPSLQKFETDKEALEAVKKAAKDAIKIIQGKADDKKDTKDTKTTN